MSPEHEADARPRVPFPSAGEPFAQFAYYRERYPAHFSPIPGGPEAWILTRHADCRKLFGESATTKDLPRAAACLDHMGSQTLESADDPAMADMVNSDDPVHARLRRAVAGAFSQRRIAALRPRVEAVASDLVAHLLTVGPADLMADFAYPLPITVISELLGLPDHDADAFKEWAITIVDADGDEVDAADGALTDYMDDVIRHKRARPGDDLLSEIAHADTWPAERALTNTEIVSMAVLLLFTGFTTTANLIGSGVLALLDHPGEMARLRHNPGLLRTGIDELIRFTAPLQLSTFRCTTSRYAAGGTIIPAGSVLLANITSANRDPAAFPDPECLDLLRDARAHLSFGHGVHRCLGAPLARAEGEIAIRVLLAGLPELRLAVPRDALEWRPAGFMRGLRSLPVTFATDAGIHRRPLAGPSS
jgi:cytochrome P450